MTERRYLIVIEREGETNYSAYSPDLPGVAATGADRSECEREMREAVEFHVDGLRMGGERVPAPRSTAGYAVVDLA